MKVKDGHKNFFIDVTLRVDSESVVSNNIPLCNLKINVKNWFLLLPSGGKSLFLRKERYEQTDFKNESTHKIVPENRRINNLRSAVRETSGWHFIFACISKSMLVLFPDGFGL